MELKLPLHLNRVLGFLTTLGRSNDPIPAVETRFGTIQGLTETSYDGRKYDKFLGIPYAEPPVGELRFQPTRPWIKTWSKPFQATQFGSECLQTLPKRMSEDCLFLNIYRPHSSNRSDDKLLPVLYFIHGSAFQWGSANAQDGSVLATTGDIIVVTSNYRLGAFGWVYADEDEMPGNLGVYDALTALTWVKDNIENFGGDPNRITLSGQSAGSMIASMFIGMPSLPDGLFQKMFLISGVSLSDQLIEPRKVALNKGKLLIEKVGCGSIFTNKQPVTSENIKCLRESNALQIALRQLFDLMDSEIKELGSGDLVPFSPVHGTKLVPEPIHIAAWKGSAKTNLDIIIGTEKDEAFRFDPVARNFIANIDSAYKFMHKKLSFVKKDLTDYEMSRFFNMYFNGSEKLSAYEIRGIAMQFVTDFSFRCPSLLLSEVLSRRNRVRGFINSYVFDKFGYNDRPYGPWHGDSVLAFFGVPFRTPSGFSDGDREYSIIMMRFLSDFVRGKQMDDWPPINLNPKALGNVQTIKEFSLKPRNVLDTKQELYLEWSKLLGFEIPRDA